ncbi:TetR/AcrR family transcriptional regulator [Streptomyces sioyaensis]|uniref:TetR/AcrR family transcriptional regulator n=1 Tax=Streptomyces sioyaensis TaxID=67364 RepID=UPI0037AB78A7
MVLDAILPRPRRVDASERIAARRAKLIEAGLALFTAQGYVSTGVKDLCREAGLTDRYFYESFANREMLLLAVFDTVTEQLLHRITQAAASAPQTSPEREQATVEAFVRELAADPRKARLLFVEVHGVNDVVRQHARAGIRRFVDLVADMIRDIDGKRLHLEEPGQKVIAHGIDRGLDVDEAKAR